MIRFYAFMQVVSLCYCTFQREVGVTDGNKRENYWICEFTLSY